MRANRRTWFVVAGAGLLLYALAAFAQFPQQGGPGGMPMGPMGPPPASAITATADGVYVVNGPRVFRLDPKTLEVVAKGELPRPEPPWGRTTSGTRA
ncbi:MAG: hypothetical protein HYU66_18455 [Armatimonadetes bacterium]|nr:hypothetical protein [Armatimonadota bacterium]